MAPTSPQAPNLAQASIEELFLRSGALRDGHFLLKSGRHSGRYLEKFLVLQYPSLGVEIGRRLARELAGYEPTLVVGPTTGGVLLAFETGRQLSEVLDVRVGYDSQALQQDLAIAFPGEDIRVRTLGEGLLLVGHVSNTGVAGGEH